MHGVPFRHFFINKEIRKIATFMIKSAMMNEFIYFFKKNADFSIKHLLFPAEFYIINYVVSTRYH